MMEHLFKVQKDVDQVIAGKIEGDFDYTLNMRRVAFKVELSELSNEIGFFKYWKQSHEVFPDRVKSEWADCLAFLLSVTISNQFENDIIDWFANSNLRDCKNCDEMQLFNRLQYNKLYDYVDIESAFIDLFKLGLKQGFSIAELTMAYISKSEVNLRRANEGY